MNRNIPLLIIVVLALGSGLYLRSERKPPMTNIEKRAYACGWLAGGFGNEESGGPHDPCNRYRGVKAE